MKKRTILSKALFIGFAVFFCGLLVKAQFGESKQLVSAASDVSGPGMYAYVNPDISSIKTIQNGGQETCLGGKCVTSGGRAWSTLQVGHVGLNKRVLDSGIVSISSIANDEFRVIETEVTVSRLDDTDTVIQTIQGKALLFTHTAEVSDNGYILVNRAQAETWIKALNGNPNYVFGGSRIRTHYVEERNTGETYVAYNLAEIANQSGGAGNPPHGDGLTKLKNDLYHKRDGFFATPRPVHDVSLVPPGSVATFSRSLVAPQKVEALSEPEPFTGWVSPTGVVAMGKEKALELRKSIGAMKITYLNGSGEVMKDVLPLSIVNYGDPDKVLVMVVDPVNKALYAPVAYDEAIDKSDGIIHVGRTIGQITRIEGEEYYFALNGEDELNKHNPYLVVRK